MKMAVFWVVAPCSLGEVCRRFRGACCLHHQGDESVNFWQTTRCNNPEDNHLHTRRRENLKYHYFLIAWWQTEFKTILFCSLARSEMNPKNKGSEFPNINAFAMVTKFHAFLSSTSDGGGWHFVCTNWTGAVTAQHRYGCGTKHKIRNGPAINGTLTLLPVVFTFINVSEVYKNCL
jgi:hypothetical protein